jgi:hypothetical protein
MSATTKHQIDRIHDRGVTKIYPMNTRISHFQFNEDEEDQAILANSMMNIGEKHGLDSNDIHKLLPAVLRMLKDDSTWSK